MKSTYLVLFLFLSINLTAQQNTILIIADDVSPDYFGCFSLNSDTANTPSDSYQSTIKKNALVVLEQKCNSCHLKKKKVVFTERNMTSQAKAIHYQVFTKKRMPKGKVKLTPSEKEHLWNWLGVVGNE